MLGAFKKIVHILRTIPCTYYCKGFNILSSCLFSVDTAKKDIVFLLDGSDSTRNGFPAMRDFVERVVEKLNVGENRDRVSVVQYSKDAEVHFYLKTYSTKEDIVDSVRGLRHKGGRPLNTGAALQYVREYVFTNSSGSRRLQGVPQMLILLNGGRSFDNVDTPASALKQQGIIVLGIGTRNSDSGELRKISYDPSYALSVSEFTDLPSVQEQLSSVMNTVLVRATPVTPTETGKKVTYLHSKIMVGCNLNCIQVYITKFSFEKNSCAIRIAVKTLVRFHHMILDNKPKHLSNYMFPSGETTTRKRCCVLVGWN